MSEQIADAWDNLPRDAKMRMFTDPGLSDLYWACARVAAHRQAVAEVEALLTPSRPSRLHDLDDVLADLTATFDDDPTTDPDHPQE